MRWHISLGTVAVVVLVGVLGYVAINEPTRMQSFTQAYDSRQIEVGAALFENNCRSCHGPQGEGIPGVAPSINDADMFNGDRLAAVSFSGTIEDYLEGVIAYGRPVPSVGTSYPQRMPTWGQEYGGPLRQDQLEGLVAFIINWEDRALAASGEGTVSLEEGQAVGMDVSVSLPVGDAQEGASFAQSAETGCSACHELAPVGPAWAAEGNQAGIGERAQQRIGQADYNGDAETAGQYLLESIVNTYAYVVEGYDASLMPRDYGDRLTAQQAADLIAYMLSLR
jgi:mono/diheme cytochrome c family protein